jgi:hypothetical protein
MHNIFCMKFNVFCKNLSLMIMLLIFCVYQSVKNPVFIWGESSSLAIASIFRVPPFFSKIEKS